jgi:hypothetical protein
MKVIIRGCVMLLVILVGTVPALPCTVVYYADEETALAGNNEDFFFPYTQATFFPPGEGKHGGVYFGYQARHGVDFGAHQGGVNDHGLFFDGLATDSVPVTRSRDKESYAGNLLKKMLEECATVEEALALFDRYDLSFMVASQFLIGDKTGDAAIIEGDAVIRKKGNYQVATNFYQSIVDPAHASCPRYRTAVQMLRAGEGRTVDSMRDILDAVHAEDGVHTVYSNVYDLKKGLIHVFHFHDYANVVTFDLAEELAKGPHTYELASLFPENDGFLAFEKIQLARLESRRREQEDALARYLADIRAPGDDPVTSPSAKDVLARYIEVIGGREALDKIRSRVTRAELTLDLMVGFSAQTTRFNGHVTMWQKRPGSFYHRIELDFRGLVIERGTDGQTGWQTHSHRAGRLLEGDEKAALLLEAPLDPHPEHLYESVECLGTTTVRGERSFKLLMTPREGKPYAAFFSRETGLLVATVSATDGPTKTVSRIDEYAEVDGVLLPRRATSETTAETVLGRRHSSVVASLSYEQNVDIPAERFAVPDEIKALVEGTRIPEPTDPG